MGEHTSPPACAFLQSARNVERDWTAAFDRVFSTPASQVEARIAREIFGSEYPEGVDAYSQLSASELRRIAAEVQVGAGATFVDVGCGRGGPGLWIAAATGADVIGID